MVNVTNRQKPRVNKAMKTFRAHIGEIISPPRYMSYTKETYCKKHKYSCGESGAINVTV